MKPLAALIALFLLAPLAQAKPWYKQKHTQLIGLHHRKSLCGRRNRRFRQAH
jgi:hypothetical protein